MNMKDYKIHEAEIEKADITEWERNRITKE